MCSGRFLGGEYGVDRCDLIFERAVEIIPLQGRLQGVENLKLPMLHRGQGDPDFDLTRHKTNRSDSERPGHSQETLNRIAVYLLLWSRSPFSSFQRDTPRM